MQGNKTVSMQELYVALFEKTITQLSNSDNTIIQ